MDRKRILIAGDHFAIRIGIKHLLKDEFPKVDFAEATNANELLAKMRKERLHLLILEINMPVRSGPEILKELREEKSKSCGGSCAEGRSFGISFQRFGRCGAGKSSSPATGRTQIHHPPGCRTDRFTPTGSRRCRSS
jgi:hypothetical protein